LADTELEADKNARKAEAERKASKPKSDPMLG
jgi:hypothetical protein